MSSPAIERAKLRVGAVLREKWRLDRLLGVGGSAAVYASTHVNNGKRAAVKMLHPELCTNREVVTRFLKEGYFSNQIDHPGAVSVIDDDRAEDGSVYLVMELLEGHSLEKYVREKDKLDAATVIYIIDQVLDLLAQAHAKNILHRDIKPANIFLTKDNRVKVLDFGIARLAEQQGENLTQTGTGIGTPSYMPPEQARGRWNLVDGRSDIFAVGATMYALLLGVRPRKAETANEELLLAMTEPMPKIETRLPDLDPALAEIVSRAIAFDMDARWPNAKAMQRALAAAQRGGDPTDPKRAEKHTWGDSTSPDERRQIEHRTPPPPPVSTRAVPDGPRYRVPQLQRTPSAAVAAVSVPEPPLPAQPKPEVRSQLPSVDVEVDLPQVDMTPATPPPVNEPSQILARRPFTTTTAMLSMAYEPQAGFILLAPHAPRGEPARYRAWLMNHNAPLWETFQGQPWVSHVKDVRAIGPLLFVGLRTSLLCLDLLTGQPRWTFALPDKLEVHPGGEDRGPVVLDFTAQNTVIVQSGSTLLALEPLSGREIWRRQFPGLPETTAVESTHFVVRYTDRGRGALEILTPQSPTAVASFGTQWFTDEASVVFAHVDGRRLAARVDKWGILLAKGVLTVDVPEKRQISFDREPNVDTAFAPQPGALGGYYIAMGVLCGPGGRRAQPPLSGHRYIAFRVVGSVVLVVLEEPGSNRLRLLGLDATSLQMKHDFGVLSPPGRFSVHLPHALPRYCLTSGEYIVYAAWASGHVELRCAHATSGQVLWTQPRHEPSPIDDAYMLGGHIVLRSADSIEVREAGRGALVARYG